MYIVCNGNGKSAGLECIHAVCAPSSRLADPLHTSLSLPANSSGWSPLQSFVNRRLLPVHPMFGGGVSGAVSMAIAPADVREVAGWMRLEKAPRRWELLLDGSYRDLITKSQQTA